MTDKKYITNLPLIHGLGSKVLKIINIFAYVELLKSKGLNYEYVYTPLSYEGFGVKFDINELGSYYHKSADNYREEYINICKNWDNMLNYNGINILNFKESEVTPYIHPGFNGESELECFNFTRKIKNSIKEKFNIIDNNINNKINIHIRRADVNKFQHKDRFLDDDYYLKVINVLKNKFSNYDVRIFTQRKNFNEELYKEFEIIYDDELNDNLAWLELINSDILVISKSSYSYSAGILCNGTVIYPDNDMFHPKLYDWKKIFEL